jgi:hypothetical protein
MPYHKIDIDCFLWNSAQWHEGHDELTYLGEICPSLENDANFSFKENESEMNVPAHPEREGGEGGVGTTAQRYGILNKTMMRRRGEKTSDT